MMSGSRVSHRALFGLLCYLLSGCGTDPNGEAGPVGTWRFDASWGDSVNHCTISGTTLTLLYFGGKWTGRLKGGDAGCEGIPGEVPVIQNPPDAVLENIRVIDDSIHFVTDSGASVFHGRFSDRSMEGVLEVFAFSQCTGPHGTGTWSATLP
jgi:hypothetical protein